LPAQKVNHRFFALNFLRRNSDIQNRKSLRDKVRRFSGGNDLKRLTAIFLLAAFAAACAYAQQANAPCDFRVFERNKAIIITGYVGATQDVVIPATINNLPVVAIGNFAFDDSQLLSVVIPSSVTAIGSYAFSKNQLTNIVIPNSVTLIGERAFFDTQLRTVIIGNGIATIENEAFAKNGISGVMLPRNAAVSPNAFDNGVTVKRQ
jgi:hypothetical protein